MGSVGVIFMSKVYGLMDKLGLISNLQIWENKDIGSPFRKASKGKSNIPKHDDIHLKVLRFNEKNRKIQ